MISGIDDLSARDVLLAVEEARRKEMSAQAETLALAAHWCDLHGEMTYDAEARVAPGDQELVGLGGDGTPDVEEFAAAEFGAMRHQHPMAARNLMAAALDLRHRLPRCWTAVHDLRLETWVACKIATMTRSLSRSAAAHVDAAIADHLESLPPGRLLALVEAKVIEADPERAEEARKQSERARFVRSTKDENGLKTLIARASAGEVIVFEAMVDRIAEILAAQGDPDLIDVRRSKAIGILARPVAALRLLLEAAHDAGVPDEDAETELTGETTPGDGPTLHDLLQDTDPTVLRPPARLFVHLADDAVRGAHGGVARVEGYGAITVEQLREWLGHSHVTATPVLDLSNQAPVDGYEFPARIKEAAHQLHPADAFPWSVSEPRQGRRPLQGVRPDESRWPTRADRPRQHRSSWQTPSPDQDLRPLAADLPLPWPLPLAVTARVLVPRRPGRHAPPARPTRQGLPGSRPPHAQSPRGARRQDPAPGSVSNRPLG
jgi:hypothetical protein